jgi:hypothetical protein
MEFPSLVSNSTGGKILQSANTVLVTMALFYNILVGTDVSRPGDGVVGTRCRKEMLPTRCPAPPPGRDTSVLTKTYHLSIDDVVGRQ